VLYVLLAIFAMTLVYENSSAIFSYLLNDNFEVASLGEKRATNIRPEIFKGLEKSLQPLIDEYPQYARRLHSDSEKFRATASLAALPDSSEECQQAFHEVIDRFYEFVTHPAVSPSQQLSNFEKELLSVARLLKIKPGKKFSFKKLYFGKKTTTTANQANRNLFEFN
jgi:hypothetical protein